MINDEWLREWTDRLRELPGYDVKAVWLRGSHARGVATPYSDVDFDVLVVRPGCEDYLAWLVPSGSGQRHVSVAVCDVDGFLADFGGPVGWALGWPVASPVRPLWTAEGWEHLALTQLSHPAGPPLLEDAMESLSKIASARMRGDELGLRLAAAELAREIPTVLRVVNPVREVRDRAEAWEEALGLGVAPSGYRSDLLKCLGIEPDTAQAVDAAAFRLFLGVIPLIRPAASSFASFGDLAGALADGRLESYAAQLKAAP